MFDDALIEPPETITLKVASNFVVARGEATLTILDNDYPLVTVLPGEVSEGNAGETNFVSFRVEYSPQVDWPVSVGYRVIEAIPQSARSGLDFMPLQGRLEFPPGVTNLSVSVPVIGDDEIELDETFLLSLTEPEGLSLSQAVAVGTIRNDDLQHFRITEVTFKDDNTVNIDFEQITASSYQIQWKNDWASPWSDVGAPSIISGSAGPLNYHLPPQRPSQGFFRLVAIP